MLPTLKQFLPFWSRAKQGEALYQQFQEEMPQEDGIYFGGMCLPENAATSHFMIVGTTGSGKTVTLRMLMRSVLPHLLTKDDHRAVVFDVKQDALSTLYEIGLPKAGVIILNPFDQRCWEWDMAKDVAGPDIAFQIASILLPEEESQNRYFMDAARDLLTGIMTVFIEVSEERQERTGEPPNWGLSDVIYATRSPDRLTEVLSQTESGRDLIELHLQGDTTPKSVISTLRTRLIPYEVIAALWSRARHANGKPRRISLYDFLRTNAVLVLGNNQSARAPIEAINRVIFQRLTELLLDQQESKSRRTWFILDEARKLGKLEGLDDLMTNGRSKGACVVLGFQDIDGLRAVYGNEIAGEITSMPASIGVLKTAGASTPQWASEIFGEQEVRESVYSYSETRAAQSSTTEGEQDQIRERKLYLPSEFRIIPSPGAENGLCGFFCSAFAFSRPYYAHIPWNEVSLRADLSKETALVDNFQPWGDKSFKKLKAWEEADLKRLNLKKITLPRKAGDPFEAVRGRQASPMQASPDEKPEIWKIS